MKAKTQPKTVGRIRPKTRVYTGTKSTAELTLALAVDFKGLPLAR